MSGRSRQLLSLNSRLSGSIQRNLKWRSSSSFRRLKVAPYAAPKVHRSQTQSRTLEPIQQLHNHEIPAQCASVPAKVKEDPHGILTTDHQSAQLLQNSALIVERQLEMMNVFLGFEQANKYVITDGAGNHVGYLAEEDGGIGKTIARQALRTHRPFTAHILDLDGNEVLTVRRPFSWINSRVQCIDPKTQKVVGEAHQSWHAWRRRYDLFLHRDGQFHQFASIDEPFLSWDFTAVDQGKKLVGSINRNFRGFGREIFTDTGCYVLRLDAASEATTSPTQQILGTRENGMTLDERAMMLATAVSVDIDYFSRHSGYGGGLTSMIPLWMPGWGSNSDSETQPEPSSSSGQGPASPDTQMPQSPQAAGDRDFASDEYPSEETPFVDDATQEPLMGDGAEGSWWDTLKDWTDDE